jgi:hypothetical protein
LTLDECREITINPLSSVLAGNQTCVCLLEADDRSIRYGIRLVSGDTEMLEVDDEGDGSGDKRSLTLQREHEGRWKMEPASAHFSSNMATHWA